MIRTLVALLPRGARGPVTAHLSLTVVSVVLRAVGAVLLVPLLVALFSEAPASAWPWAVLFTAVVAAGWIVDWIVANLAFALGFGLLDAGQRAVAARLSRVRLGWFTAENTATARQAVASTGPDLVGLIVYLVTPLLSTALLPIAIAVAITPIAWQLGVAALAGVPVLFGAYWLSGRLARGADRAMADGNSALTERIVEFARTQHALRAARRVEPERSHVGNALSAQHAASVRLLLMQIPGQLIFSVASQVALILLAGTVVLLAAGGVIVVPAAIGLIVVVVRYLEPFTALAELSGGVEPSLITLKRIGAVLEAQTMPSGTESLPAVGRPPRIELRGVGFRYAPDQPPVLDGLHLAFEPGTTTAIVGPSGSGKSTVLAILAGLHEPTTGSVLVDGRDAAHLAEQARRDLVSVVFQHPYLFEGTIRENVRVGDPGAEEPALHDAGRRARIDGVVNRLPGGWDAPVGEGGAILSGGERQRVSIARALLKPAPLLLVDEATSALDTENERAVTAALKDDPTSRTTVIVAHRLASIRAADRVVFLEDGRVVEDGSVDDLLGAGGRFARFWRQQDSAAGWQLGQEEKS